MAMVQFQLIQVRYIIVRWSGIGNKAASKYYCEDTTTIIKTDQFKVLILVLTQKQKGRKNGVY